MPLSSIGTDLYLTLFVGEAPAGYRWAGCNSRALSEYCIEGFDAV